MVGFRLPAQAGYSFIFTAISFPRHLLSFRLHSHPPDSSMNRPIRVFLPVPLLILVLAGSLPARDADPEWANQKGITAGTLVPGSVSPDGKHALYEFFNWEAGTPESANTQTGIGLAPTDRSKLLFRINSRTKWSTDKEVNSFLSTRWNPESTLLATHDSMDKHSKLCIYRLAGGSATELEIPDLLPVAAKKLKIDVAKVASSGQVPLRWKEAGVLEVSVRLTTAAQGKPSTILLVQVDPQGKVTVP